MNSVPLRRFQSSELDGCRSCKFERCKCRNLDVELFHWFDQSLLSTTTGHLHQHDGS